MKLRRVRCDFNRLLVKCFLVLAIFVSRTNGQSPSSNQLPQEQFTQSVIQDNSFLIEEAFNQEEGVVQHISNAVFYTRPEKDFTYTFTQEWPLSGQRHQISFTVPYFFLNSNVLHGFGDVLVNYRYQLLNSSNGVAIAPRLSLIIPIGRQEDGLGIGVAGIQSTIPASIQITAQWITHFNVGITLFPGVRSTTGSGEEARKTLSSYYAGASAIWLVASEYNLMLETLMTSNASIDDRGDVRRENEIILSPGFRFAINLNRLQIVPGVALPVKINNDGAQVGLFFISLV